jgi:hypothetical protein
MDIGNYLLCVSYDNQEIGSIDFCIINLRLLVLVILRVKGPSASSSRKDWKY